MAELLDYETSDAFHEQERLVLRLASRMTASPARIEDTLFAALRQQFSEAQLVELASVIAMENYRARFNRVFGIESQGFND